MAGTQRPLEIKEKDLFKDRSFNSLDIIKWQKTKISSRLQQEDRLSSKENSRSNEHWRGYSFKIPDRAVYPSHCYRPYSNIIRIFLAARKKMLRQFRLLKIPTKLVLNKIWVQHVRVEILEKPLQGDSEVDMLGLKKSKIKGIQGAGIYLKKVKGVQIEVKQSRIPRFNTCW